MRLFDPSEFASVGSDPVAMMRFTISVISAPGFLERAPEVVNALLANVAKEPTRPGAFMAQLQAILGSDRAALVRNLRCPTLIVHGTEDKLIPCENGKALAATIPGAKLVLLEHCGHMAMWEMPDVLARIVTDFLSS
jgi:pimeloyl-ACP methyl ester carboxylesterase